METWWTLYSRHILYAPCVISVHVGVALASLESASSDPELNALPTGLRSHKNDIREDVKLYEFFLKEEGAS